MIFPDWDAPASVRALCTTRQDSESDIPRALGVPDLTMVAISQVHGTDVVRAEAAAGRPQADAIFSNSPGLGCRIVTADCLPILLAHRAGAEVAAVHAGWRGLAAGVVEATVGAMRSAPADLLAWIGPAISQPHYEVGCEVYEAFVAGTGDRELMGFFKPSGDRYLANLAGLARLRLRRLGVGPVSGGDLCTYADPLRFHSWRRDGEAAGRLCSAICIAA